MSRIMAYVLGGGTLCAVLAPALAAPGWDSYPLSSYPMFTQNREKPLLHFMEMVDEQERRARVAPQLIANDEVMQAVVTVRRAVRRGEAALASLCQETARRLAASEPEPAWRRLEIVSARFDPVRYFVEGPTPEERTVHFTCAVDRASGTRP